MVISSSNNRIYQSYDRIYVLLRVNIRIRNPGCLHISLTEIGGEGGQLIINNTFQSMLFRVLKEQSVPHFGPQRQKKSFHMGGSRHKEPQFYIHGQESEEMLEYTQIQTFSSGFFTLLDGPSIQNLEYRPYLENDEQHYLQYQRDSKKEMLSKRDNQGSQNAFEPSNEEQTLNSKLYYVKQIQVGDDVFSGALLQDRSLGVDMVLGQQGQMLLDQDITKLIFCPYRSELLTKHQH